MTGDEHSIRRHAPPRGPSSAPALRIVLAVGVALATVLVFWPATDYGFINFDDPAYVTQNPYVQEGLGLAGLRFAINVGHTGNWHPVTWLSHMLDVSLFGMHPGYHHLHNVVLHGTNAALLMLVLLRLVESARPACRGAGPALACAFAALVFAVHPLRLESVVWISERKDLLAAFFWMLTLLAYSGYARCGGRGRLAAVTALFAMALMAKPMAITLPLILCILDVWPLRRLRDGSSGTLSGLVLEKAPLLALSAGSALLTLLAQSRGGALNSLSALTLPDRVSVAMVAYVRYLVDLFRPVRLAVFYPLPPDGFPTWKTGLCATVLVAISVAVVAFRRRHPILLAGWAWYVVTAAPVIGLIKVGQQAGADRYTYLPLIGPVAALTWVAVGATRTPRWAPALRAVLATAVIVALVGSTRAQIGYWRDSKTLFRRALEVTEANHLAHYSLSLEYAKEGDLEGALHHGHEAVTLYPLFYDAYLHLAEIHAQRGEFDDARFLLSLAIGHRPQQASGYVTLGQVQLAENRPLEALSAFEEAVARAPSLASAHYHLGLANEQLGRLDEALLDYESAFRLAPGDFEAAVRLGHLALARERPALALAALERAVAMRPAQPEALGLLALTHLELGDLEAAEQRCRDLRGIDPGRAYQVRERIDAALPRRRNE